MLETENLNGIFEWIIDLYDEGKEEEAREMYNKLTESQKTWFSVYAEEFDFEVPF